MCIIASKPYGVTTFDLEKVKFCFENNPDGAGYAFSVKGDKHIRFRKGFMSYKTFVASLQSIVFDRYDLADVQLLLHYRITTHGGTRPENTHPFCITNDPKRLQGLKGRTDTICAMNGIVSTDIPKGSTMSDTMHYIANDLVFPYALRSDFFRSKAFPDFIGNTGAKWVFMDIKGIETFGEFNKNDGWSYSNYSYEESVWQSWSGYGKDYSYTWRDYPTDNASFEYGYEKAVADELDFCGVLITDSGEYIEVCLDDDIYISKTNKVYKYNYDTDTLMEITNVSSIFDEQFTCTSYTKMIDTGKAKGAYD